MVKMTVKAVIVVQNLILVDHGPFLGLIQDLIDLSHFSLGQSVVQDMFLTAYVDVST